MKLISLILFVLCLHLSLTSSALASSGQAGIAVSGIFQGYDSDNNSILVSASKYPLASTATVSTLKQKYMAVEDLQAGDEVGLGLTHTGQGKVLVDKIWLLPKGSVIQH